MKYYRTIDKQWLDEANTRVLRDNPENTTQSWVMVIKHPEREEWAACIPDDYFPRIAEILTQEEIDSISQQMSDSQFMILDGWVVS